LLLLCPSHSSPADAVFEHEFDCPLVSLINVILDVEIRAFFAIIRDDEIQAPMEFTPLGRVCG
jgi:hypothetical protein